jgi:hypothetical protein
MSSARRCVRFDETDVGATHRVRHAGRSVLHLSLPPAKYYPQQRYRTHQESPRLASGSQRRRCDQCDAISADNSVPCHAMPHHTRDATENPRGRGRGRRTGQDMPGRHDAVFPLLFGVKTQSASQQSKKHTYMHAYMQGMKAGRK